MRGKWITVVLIAVFVVGLSLLVYPTISNTWNARTQSRVIANYDSKVQQLDNTRLERLMRVAQAFNQELSSKPNQWFFTSQQREEYEAQLSVSGQGAIGYLKIPKIGVSLPIYLGTGEAVLQVAVGHMGGSSLPIGGLSTHSVLTGHRGLPSAKLFTDLDKLDVGDVFQITVLREILTYEIDQVLVVAQDEARDLRIIEGEDYCTLLTCTPYGINTERLLVRGQRIDTIMNGVDIIPNVEGFQHDAILIATLIIIPSTLLLIVLLLIGRYKKRSAAK